MRLSAASLLTPFSLFISHMRGRIPDGIGMRFLFLFFVVDFAITACYNKGNTAQYVCGI